LIKYVIDFFKNFGIVYAKSSHMVRLFNLLFFIKQPNKTIKYSADFSNKQQSILWKEGTIIVYEVRVQ